MKLRVSLLLAGPLLLAAQAPVADQAAGPRATAGNGEASAYDAVGFARIGPGTGMTAAHATLPLGSIAEVTALDSGQIILARITARSPATADAEIELTQAAARALGLSGEMDAVRVRSIQPSAADVAALRAGGTALPRLPAPDALLRALRRKVPGLPASEPAAMPPIRHPSSRPLPSATPSVRAAAAKPAVTTTVPRGRYLVQVAALRDEQRARGVARDLGGRVEGAGGLWRVRLGPFADRAMAQRRRDAAISRGYGGATIIPAS